MPRDPDRAPTHPGAPLREDIVPAMGKTSDELADLLGIPSHRMNDILAERASVTPEIAEGLARLIGNSSLFWSRMQDANDGFGPRGS